MTEKRQLPTNKHGEKDYDAALNEAKALAGNRQAAEERAIKSISIQQYRSELDAQLQLQSEKLQAEMQEKRRLGDEFKTRQRMMLQQQQESEQARKDYLTNLRREYDVQAETKKQTKRTAREAENQEERKRIEQNEIASKREQEQKNQYKSYLSQIEESQIREKQARMKNQRNLSLQEIMEDNNRVQYNLDSFDKRDKDYADYYNKVSQSIDRKMNFFQPNINSELNLYQRRENHIRDNQVKHQQIMSTKAEQEDNIRRVVAANTRNAVAYQIKEKEERKERERAMRSQENTEMQARVRSNQAQEQQMRFLRAQEQAEYHSRLDNQINYKNYTNAKQSKMQKPERTLNRDLINDFTADKPIDFTQVPGNHPRISPLKQALYGRAAHRVSNTFEGASMGNPFENASMGNLMNSNRASRQSDGHLGSRMNNARSAMRSSGSGNYFDNGCEKHRTAENFEFAFNSHRHNPITNAIGEFVPRPSPGATLHRGKGSQYLRETLERRVL